MPSIWKRVSSPSAVPYQFPNAAELMPEEPVIEMPAEVQEEAEEEFSFANEMAAASQSLDFVDRSEQLLRNARRQADEILENARRKAEEEAEALYEKARQEGREAGYAEGVKDGTEQALEEGRAKNEEAIKSLSEEVSRFLHEGNRALERQMSDNVEEMKELAIAVAEKVISVSLKSSSEVIGRMVQAAVDRRKHQEWVRVYVAECDVESVKLSPSLTAALSALSDQVRIIPMAEDEPGTCIIEMPDEIVDASASTQIDNIRTILSEISFDKE